VELDADRRLVAYRADDTPAWATTVRPEPYHLATMQFQVAAAGAAADTGAGAATGAG
jgi:hypothetical protein